MNQHCIKPFSTPEVYRYRIGKVVKRAPNNAHCLTCTVGIQRGLSITLIICLLHGRRDSSLTCNSSVII
ncbi:hypothetical protein P692DRAFT_20833190 [Suillus brevipes Sb2]|nr:hypothetical protein P692DRAFT_20833190 [Suillus brevipes Sb2]